MDRGRAAAALLALAACIACSTAAPTSSETALEISEGPSSGCYYNFQHYGEGDRIMTNEPCLNCTCHNRMLMCYLRVCPFTKPIGQDCTIEKRADQCCPIVTCPDVPVDLLTSTSTSSPAEYGATGLGKLDKYGCSINGKYFPEGSKVPPSPNKPCEHCYCIRNMTTCVMQECTLHVDGCTPIYHKDVCCPVRYSCDHPEDEIPLLDDMTTTIRPTPGFLLTTTTMMPVTQPSQNCVHDDQIVPDGALIKTEKACEHCYCMKGDIVCVVQECGTPMENEGKNCTSLPPRQGQCCPDTYICEGDEASTEETTEMQEITTSPPRRYSVEGSGYRLEPDEAYTEIPSFVTEEEGSGEEHFSTVPVTDKSFEKPTQTKGTSTTFDVTYETSTEIEPVTNIPAFEDSEKHKDQVTTEAIPTIKEEEQVTTSPKEYATSVKEEDNLTTNTFDTLPEEILTTETPTLQDVVTTKVEKTTRAEDMLDEATLKEDDLVPEKEHKVPLDEYTSTTPVIVQDEKTTQSQEYTTLSSVDKLHTDEIVTPEIETQTLIDEIASDIYTTTPKEKFDVLETTSINPVENEINESDLPIYSPGRIPGEGDCLLNTVTYQNNSVVPSTNNCHTSCKCISSIIKCEPIVCSAPPEYMNDCQPIYDSPDSCCPTYVCSTKETTPPESHNQMSESESPKPILAIECSSPDCKSVEDKFAALDCSNNECVPKDKVQSQDTPISCDDENCKVDSLPQTHPDLHHDAPVECSAENGCTKPKDTQTGNDCLDGNCKVEPAPECTGSDCNLEITKDTTHKESVATTPEYSANELTVKPDTTDKIETQTESENKFDLSTQGLNIESQPTGEYITVPTLSSTEIPQTETSQSGDIVTASHEVTHPPDYYTTHVDTIYTEPSAVGETESDVSKQQQSTSEPITSEFDDSYKDVSQGTSDQTTARTNEQAVTEGETVTVGSYETKLVEPVTEEISVTYSQEPNKEPITPAVGQVTEINEDATKLPTESTHDATESILKETATSQEPVQSEVVQEDTDMPDIIGPTISGSTITETIESSTLSYSKATESEHKLITKLDEHYTETPSSLGYEDKATETVSVITESNVKITDAEVTESGEYKPVPDETKDKITDVPEIHTELPMTEVTKLTKPRLDTTTSPDVTESDQDHVTVRIEEQTETSPVEHKEVTTESISTDANIIQQQQTTEQQLDLVTSAILRDRESENAITVEVPTERIVGGDVTMTELLEGVQETYTSVPEIKITKISTSSQSGYNYQSTSPRFDEKVETTARPIDEELINITTEREPDVTSETIASDITEKEQQEVGTTRPQENVPMIQDTKHEYYTTETSYQASSQATTYEDLSDKLDVTTVSPIHVEETATTQKQEELSSTERVTSEINKDDEQQVPVATTSYHEATTDVVSVTDTMSPTYSSEAEQPSMNTQQETDVKSETTEANIKYEDTHTTESEIKVNVDLEDTLGPSTVSQGYDVEPHTESIKPDIPTKEETYTVIPSDTETEKPSKEMEMEQEKITEISEPVTVIPEKAETTIGIKKIGSETKSPETYTTSIRDIVFDTSTVVSDVSEYETKELVTEAPFISTTPKAIDTNVEITTVKEVGEEADIEQHTEAGSGEEDIVTSSPTPTSGIQDNELKQDISTSEIFTPSSATEIPIEVTQTSKEHKETTPATFESSTLSYVETQKDTSSPSEIESATVTRDVHDESTEIMPSIDESTLQTRQPEELEPEVSTEKIVKESTEPQPERNDQESERPLEVSTPTSIHEEISTPQSALSLVTDESDKKYIKPHTDLTSTIPVQDKDTFTTETSFVDQGLSSTEKLATKPQEILTTIQQEPLEHEEQTTSSGEKLYSPDLSTYPEVISEYPERTTVVQITDKEKEIAQSPITEVSQTILPETTYESHPVTQESTASQILFDTTTQKLLETETEKEDTLEKTTKSPTDYEDKYDTETTVLDREKEKQSTTKETVPNVSDYGTTQPVEIYSEKEDIVTKLPSDFTDKQTTEQTEKVPDTQEATSVSPDTISDKDSESQLPTEQSIPSIDQHDVTTALPTEKVTEKETGAEESTNAEVPTVPVEEQTEKEILREPNKDILETTTFVAIDKQEGAEVTSVTEESTETSSYERTTLKSPQEDTEHETVTQQTTQEEILSQPTTLRLPEKETEKETESGVQLIDTTSDTLFTTLSASSSTPTSKLPEPTDDTQKVTEPAMEYSETTPYLIELQEHTHQSTDELSSKMPTEGESTTEQYISEHPDRGDIPHKDYDENVTPTSPNESMDVTTPKENKSTTTTKVMHDETPTEAEVTTAQSPSEIPKEEDRYTISPIETEKPLTTPEIEAHTEKHIPGDYESHKPDVSEDVTMPTEEAVKETMSPVFTKPTEESIVHTDDLYKHEEKPIEGTEVSKPELNKPSDDLPSPDFPPSGAGGYGQEPDYGDSEDQAFGPGTCRYGGKVYVSAQQIPRDDPCDFCFCFRSDIICLQQSCPPPIHGCHEEPIQGFCCPRYECPVSMATTLNVTTTTTTTTTTLPPHFLPHAYKGAAQRRGCQIKGHTYKVGEVVRASSGPCLHCTCGGDGQMKCDPKACTPEPMLRQMIAAAVSAKRRR
ncbi:uncharacterized threonine-rich GPI-anchored glycoprotein PJ4664.02 [Aricia agestis]|uniref:uncharacterized threonine-rich GPI-anchored glycoprotein PJ4664.02 n=1 Tax=Aricia agestis TaxID=91739 RepID=UPI001C204A0E|nr:uncharacterized threonine-rich GPI-anchored glycoprotein PJ4664.02 [Aricia agestis]